jgi:hypothetical protein
VAYALREDGNGTTVFQTAETLEADLFAKTRSADYLVDLPIERLNKDPHRLTIEATAGQATSRSELRFTTR